MVELEKREGPDAATRRQEAAALYKLWKKRALRSQHVFALHLGWTQGNVGHYLKGRRPLNLAAALAFAAELQVSVEEFSPRIAKQLEEGKQRRPRWPFGNISREDWAAFTDGQRMELEGLVLRRIEEWRAAPDKSTATRPAN